MSRDYSREYAIGNWPPDHLDPVDPPLGIVRELDEIDHRHQELIAELQEWRERNLARRAARWIAYHEEHGWPDDGGLTYRFQLKSEAGLLDGVP